MREYATTLRQTSCNPLDYLRLMLLTDESVTQLLLTEQYTPGFTKHKPV